MEEDLSRRVQCVHLVKHFAHVNNSAGGFSFQILNLFQEFHRNSFQCIIGPAMVPATFSTQHTGIKTPRIFCSLIPCISHPKVLSIFMQGVRSKIDWGMYGYPPIICLELSKAVLSQKAIQHKESYSNKYYKNLSKEK